MIRFLTVALALFCSAAASALPSVWQGTWSTNHGELRLASLESSFVIGDYADRGIIVGRLSGQRLRGIYTNGSGVGEVDLTLGPNRTFSGSWRTRGASGSGSWTGRRTSSALPSLSNFARDGRAVAPQDNRRNVYDGTYSSDFGEIRLHARNLLLVGDYGDVGALAGVWDGNSYVGVFTNGGRAGWFDFEFLSRTGSFRSGRWGWIGSQESRSWALQKVRSGMPTIGNLGGGSASAAPRRAASQPMGRYLRRGMGLDLDRVRTLVSMQEHVQWVSGDEATARDEMEDNQFTMHGGGFIDTEASGLDRLFTTGRLRAYVAHRGTDLVISFRGSGGSNIAQTIGNGGTDALIVKRKMDLIQNSPRLTRTNDDRRNARVHMGFARAYERLRPQILAAVDANPDKNVYVFGHSLGGALATICAVDLSLNRVSTVRSITHIVSGSPRVGNGVFRDLFESAVPNNMRMTIHRDPVPKIPRGYPARLLPNRHYRHVGRLLPVTANGTIQSASQIDTGRGNNTPGNHANTVYLQAARDLLQRVEANPSILNGVNIGALGNAERTSAVD